MKKLFKALAVLMTCIMTTGIVACGGQTSGTEESESSDNSKVTIIVPDLVTSTTGTGLFNYNMQQQFKKDYPEIEVKHVANPVTESAKTIQGIVNNINSSDACTVLATTAANYSRSLYQMGITEDFSKYLTKEDIAQFRPEIIQSLTSGTGALVGLPSSLETPLIGFNRKHLRSEYVRKAFLGEEHMNDADAEEQIDAILDKIETWDDYYNVLLKLTGSYTVDYQSVDVSGYAGYYTDYYLGIGIWSIANGYTVSSQNPDGTLNLDLTDKGTVEVIEFLQKLAQDGITKLQPGIGFNEFYNAIFANRVASFIYYPSWSGWFETKAMYASDIKVIPMPYGPSIARLKEAQKTDSSIVVPNTSASFSINYVMNKNATEEQKKAVTKYLMYMIGTETALKSIEFRVENEIESFILPSINLTNDYLKETILKSVPVDWTNSVIHSLSNLYVLTLDSDVWITYISADIPSLIKKGTEYNGDKLIERLQSLNARIKSEWLDYYNEKYAK